MSKVRLPALVILAVLLAAATCVSTANAQGAWTTYAGTFGGVLLNSVYMVDAGNGWAVGNSGTILRYSGGSWTRESSPFGGSLWSVYMLSTSDGWAVGTGGTILHYDGTSWSIRPEHPTTNDLFSVYMVSANEGWAVGALGTILYYDGHAWSGWLSPENTNDLFSVFMSDAADGWAVGAGGMILDFVSPTWVMTTTSPTTHPLRSVYMVSANEGWAVGQSGTILHYDGTSWTGYPMAGAVLTYGASIVNLYSVSMVNANEGWAVGTSDTGGIIAHYATPSWNAYQSFGNVLDYIYMLPGGTEGWAVGDAGTMLHYSVPSTAVYPAVVTEDPQAIAANSAELYGTVNPNGARTTYQFRDYETNTPICPASPTTLPYLDNLPHRVHCTWSSLTANTRRQYTITASNAMGHSATGLPKSFRTAGGGGASPDFTFSCVPLSVTVSPGTTSAPITCTVASLNGFSAPVTFGGSWSGGVTPTGVTPNPPAPVTPPADGTPVTATLSIQAASSAPTGGPFTYYFTATSDTLAHSAAVSVAVNVSPWTEAGPTVATLPPATDVTDTSAVLHGTVNGNGLATTWDFEIRDPSGTETNCPVQSLDVTSTPQGVSCRAIGLRADTDYQYRIRATDSNGQSSWGDFLPFHTGRPAGTPDFTFSCVPSSVTVAQGTTSAPITCTVASLNGFSGSVTFSDSWSGGVTPTGVTPNLPSAPVTPSADGTPVTTALSIQADISAPTGGPFTYYVTATSGTLSHTSGVTVQISPGGAGAADFSIAACSSSLSLGPGASTTCTVTVESVGGFSSSVGLNYSGAPSGLNLVFSPTSVTPPASSVLTVTVAGAAIGDYPITITGTSGTITHTTTLTVHVAAAGGGCLIATATYGSELAPEVQFLRGFRDNSILKTNAGSSFMVAFNAWYYSFSPYVADFIRGNSLARTVTRLMLYPLMGILRLGASVFYALPGNLEVGAVMSGLLVSSLIGIVYVSPPLMVASACSRRVRRIAKRLELPVVAVMLGAVVALAFMLGVGAPQFFMMFSTAAVVLATLAASALYATQALLHLLKQAHV